MPSATRANDCDVGILLTKVLIICRSVCVPCCDGGLRGQILEGHSETQQLPIDQVVDLSEWRCGGQQFVG